MGSHDSVEQEEEECNVRDGVWEGVSGVVRGNQPSGYHQHTIRFLKESASLLEDCEASSSPKEEGEQQRVSSLNTVLFPI